MGPWYGSAGAGSGTPLNSESLLAWTLIRSGFEFRFRCAIIPCDEHHRPSHRPRRGRRELRQGHLRAAAAPGHRRHHERARRAARRDARPRGGHGQEAGPAGARPPRAVPRRRAHRGGRAACPRGAPPPPAARALPGRGPRDAVGPRPRRGRGPRARHLRGARGAHRRQARPPDPRSPWRPDPHAGPDDRGAGHASDAGPGRRGPGSLRADLGLRPRDAALLGGSRDRARRPLRGRREAAVRRTGVRAFRGRDARPRRNARAGDARGDGGMSPPPPPLMEASAVALPSPSPSAPRHASDLQEIRSRGRLRGAVAILGPAFVACIAYVDPGNFATNIAGGAKFGYLLLWVLLAANLMAMVIQNLSAKIGIATGKNLPELCRENFARPVTVGLWVQAEIIAMATDLAEFVGAAIALNLLFDVPLFPAGLMTAVVAFGILGLQSRGYRRFELAVIFFLGIILLGFLYDTLNIGADAGGVAGGLIPGFAGGDSILLATGILGATVMPHVIYLHSALTQNRISPRDAAEKRKLLRFQRVDVFIAMGSAGVVTMSMLAAAAGLFHARGLTGIDSIEGAHT